jgi:hypothetical protein
MSKVEIDLDLLEIGELKNETYETIKVIKNFTFAIDFIRWLSNDNFERKIFYEEVSNGKYKRIGHFYIHDTVVYTGRGEYILEHFSYESIKFLKKGNIIDNSSVSEFSNFEKEVIAKAASNQHYSLSSRLFNKGEIAGFGWEIFELPRIYEIYSNNSKNFKKNNSTLGNIS